MGASDVPRLPPAEGVTVWHWRTSSAAGFVLTLRLRPLCSIVYEANDSAARRGFLRAADWWFEEVDHCRRIALTYRLGAALRRPLPPSRMPASAR